MSDAHDRIAAYCYTDLSGQAADQEIANQDAAIESEIVRLGARRVATYTDASVREGIMGAGLTELLEAARRFDFDTILVLDKHIFITDEYASRAVYDCHVAVRFVGEEDADHASTTIARTAMPWLARWAWEDERATKMRRRKETDMIIERVYDQTTHMPPSADFVSRLRQIGSNRGIPMDGEQGDEA